jgi:phosphate:Na+ symporter
MTVFNTIITVLAAIMLFLFSLKGFSGELKELGADRLNAWLSKVTQNRFKGFLVGLFMAALIQSSSAVSSITVTLVDAAVISFQNSLSVLIGANVGTTFTAWLVALKMENLGSILLVVGALIGMIPFRFSLAGKSIFYLGLILFSLEQISLTLKPLAGNEIFMHWLSYSNNIFLGILMGAFITAVLQSSSVVSGLAIILAQQQLLTLEGAIAIVMGANIGTSSTALIASVGFTNYAKNAARANAFFNVMGVVIFLPFFYLFTSLIDKIPAVLTYKIAIAHLIFNLTVAIIFLIFLKPVANWFQKKKKE